MDAFSYHLSGSDLWTWRERAIAQAHAAHIDRQEVDWLLQGLCQVEGLALRLGTLAQQAEVPAQVSLTELQQLWERRVRDRVPIQHLVGKTEWRNLVLRVTADVLIPRPETELIIEIAENLANQSPRADELKRGTWVDMGTGSGAIALGLAAVFPLAKILAVDISAAALAIAQQNAEENGLGERIQFIQGSWFEPVTAWRGQLAGMVSNPPYIPHAIVPTLEPEVTQHEPHQALDGGVDGLEAVRKLVSEAPAYLVSEGIWLVEHMIDQAPDITHLLNASDQFANIQIFQDLAGIERFVAATKTSPGDHPRRDRQQFRKVKGSNQHG